MLLDRIVTSLGYQSSLFVFTTLTRQEVKALTVGLLNLLPQSISSLRG